MSKDISQAVATLNEAQQEAVRASAQNLLIIAGAGSGKTRVLVTRMLHFMKNHQVSPLRILAVTFTNKAAKEMRSRIEAALGHASPGLWVGTFHGIAHRVLRAHWEAAGLPAEFQIIDPDDQKRLVRRLMKELRVDEELWPPKQVIAYISRLKDDGRRAQAVRAGPDMSQQTVLELYRRYEAECQRLGLVDFGELLLRVHELWREHPEILEQYQSRFTHVLVDEFQDTNAIQYAWLKQLCGPNQHLTVVGDDDQSIYGWRGAKIENIQRFTTDYAGTQVVRLEQNYRSTGTILSAANALIAKNEGRLGKQLWTESDPGEKISVYMAMNECDEADFMVEKMQMWKRRGGSYSDIAVLYRSNVQSRVIEQALRRANLPYKIYGGLRFFERAEIRDVLAYLRLISHRDDDPAFERVVNLPPRGIGDKSFQSIRAIATEQNITLWEAAKQYLPQASGRAGKGLETFLACIDSFDEGVSLAEIVQDLLDNHGLLQHYQNQPGEKAQTRVDNLSELLIATKQFQQDVNSEESPLKSFLSEVALDMGDHGEEKSSEYVSLMTLHSAKGLEYPLVFIGGLEEGLFPHHRSALEPEKLEEERRLCYVGITRAMHKLYLCYAQRRAFSMGARQTLNQASRFISEVPGKWLDNLQTAPAITMPTKAAAKRTPIVKGGLGEDFPFKLGQRVRHARFGDGIIVSGEGQGKGARLQVNFDRTGSKWLVLAYANLQAV